MRSGFDRIGYGGLLLLILTPVALYALVRSGAAAYCAREEGRQANRRCLLAVSLLGAAMLAMGDSNGTEAVRGRQAMQAFWGAEAGLHAAIARLRLQSAFRASPATVNGTCGLAAYAVAITRAGAFYTLTSRAQVARAYRTVAQTVEINDSGWPDAFDYAVFGTEGNVDLKKGLNVSGDMFAYGNISLAKESTVTNGEVYATGAVTGSGNFTVGTLPDVLPQQPTFDTSWYVGKIATAAASGVAPGTVSFPLNLAGGTLYVQGNLDIRNITGAGTLVVSGNLGLAQDVTIASGVTLLSGATLTLAKDCETGSNTVFYAQTGIVLAKDGLTLNGCALLTPGDIDCQKSFTMGGAMYAGGTVGIKKDAVVTGSIIGATGVTADMNLSVYHDPSAFPPVLPPGFTPTVSVAATLWTDRGSAAF
jgi:hypothetical protein